MWLLMFIYYIIVFIGFVCKNRILVLNKIRINCVLVVQTLIYSLLVGGYVGNGDLGNYRRQYIRDFKFNLEQEILYDFLGNFFYKMGFSFDTFHLIISSACVILIAVSISKMTRRPCFVMSLFMLFPGIIMAEQFKQLISVAIIMVGIVKFLQNKNILQYMVFCVIATGFHFSAIFFVVFVLSIYFDYKKIIMMDLVILVLGIIFKMTAIASLLGYILPQDIVSEYIIGTHYSLPIWKSIAFALWQMGMCLTGFYFVYKEQTKINMKLKMGLLQQISLIFYFFTFVNVRFVYVTFALISGETVNRLKENKKIEVGMKLYLILVAIISGLFIHPIFEIYEVFSNNVLIAACY